MDACQHQDSDHAIGGGIHGTADGLLRLIQLHQAVQDIPLQHHKGSQPHQATFCKYLHKAALAQHRRPAELPVPIAPGHNGIHGNGDHQHKGRYCFLGKYPLILMAHEIKYRYRHQKVSCIKGSGIACPHRGIVIPDHQLISSHGITHQHRHRKCHQNPCHPPAGLQIADAHEQRAEAVDDAPYLPQAVRRVRRHQGCHHLQHAVDSHNLHQPLVHIRQAAGADLLSNHHQRPQHDTDAGSRNGNIRRQGKQHHHYVH